MKIVKKFFLLLLVILFVFLDPAEILALSPNVATSVIPNEAIITGKILGIEKIDSSLVGIEPKQTLWKLEVSVLSSREASGRENRSLENSRVTVYSNENLNHIRTGAVIESHIIYKKNEKEKIWWAENIKLLEEPSTWIDKKPIRPIFSVVLAVQTLVRTVFVSIIFFTPLMVAIVLFALGIKRRSKKFLIISALLFLGFAILIYLFTQAMNILPM